MKQKVFSFLIAVLLFNSFGQLQQAYALSASGANDDVRFINQQTDLLKDCQSGSLQTCERELNAAAMKVRDKLRSVQSKLHPYDTKKMQEATARFILRAREILASINVSVSSLEEDFNELESIAEDLPTSLMPSLAASENRTFPKLASLLRDSETLLVDAPKIKKYAAKLVNFEIDVTTVMDDAYAEFSGLLKNSISVVNLEYLNQAVLAILENVDEAVDLAERRLSSKLDDDFEVIKGKVEVKRNEMKSKLSNLQPGTIAGSGTVGVAGSGLNAAQLIVSLMRADSGINKLKVRAQDVDNRSDFYGLKDSLWGILEAVKVNLGKAGDLNSANQSLVRLYVGYINEDSLDVLGVLEQNLPSRMDRMFQELRTQVVGELADITSAAL